VKASLHTDGGARGNPGPSAIGFVLEIPGQAIIAVGECIGNATNNQAEYEALLRGLNKAVKEGVQEIVCYLDSELVVKQLKGEYKVRDADLKKLFDKVKDLAKKFTAVEFIHVRREKNKQADKLVNKALDDARP
jgi:ribonuclease HI